jgi:type IV pilus assembly protein PilN
MIRINLLPIREKRRRATGQRHIFVILILLAIECMGFFYVYNGRAEDLSDRKSVNRKKQGEIDKLKNDIGNIETLKSQKADLEQQQEILDALELGRSGPVRVLDEMSFLLTSPADARARLDLERRGAQPNWDPKRVWLKSFVEQDRNVTIVGEAKDNDDVAEFLTRLASSDYFRDVQLLWTKGEEAKDIGQGLRFVRFNVRCRVSYVGKGNEAFVPNTASFKKGKKG